MRNVGDAAKMPAAELTIEAQFPGFDNTPLFKLLLDKIPGATDASWERDTSPCILAPGVEIWVDFAMLENREFKEGKTFTLFRLDQADTPTGAVFETDSVVDAIRVALAFAQTPKIETVREFDLLHMESTPIS